MRQLCSHAKVLPRPIHHQQSEVFTSSSCSQASRLQVPSHELLPFLTPSVVQSNFLYPTTTSPLTSS